MSEPERPGGLKAGGLKAVLISVFRGVDLARRLVVNGLFLLAILLLWIWTSSDGRPEVPDSTALVLAPRGVIVEQLAGDAVARAVQKLTGSEVPEALLSDLVDAVDTAADDDRVRALFLDLGQLLGAALPRLQELRRAIEDFKAAGKTVIAAADFYNNARYHLAAGADEIYLHPMGLVMFEGYGRYRTYYKEGLDRYGVDWNVFRVGEYKSAVEPYLEKGMSEEVRDVNREWLGGLWGAYLADVAAPRQLDPAKLGEQIERYDELLAEDGGDTAGLALRLGLVDHLEPADAIRQRLIDLVGEDEDSHSFRRIGYLDYLEATRPEDDGDSGEVAVIVAKGTILPGQQPPGAIGGESTSALVRQARHDDGVKAVVLRVDSGGGSAFASEVIRRELELVREAGKPVVVSMGSYAASGGYWIATSSDEIWASPNTVTGSIGIFSYFPTFQKPLAKYLGISVDGVGTTWLAGVRPDRALPEEMRTSLQLMVEQGYRDFLERVGTARGMAVDEVDEIAQGRVWSGAQAHEIGLVDQLGGLDDAIAAAAERAGLGDDYRLRYFEEELDFKDRLLISMLTRARAFYRPAAPPVTPPLVRAGRHFLAEVDRLVQFRDPKGLYAHCLCEID